MHLNILIVSDFFYPNFGGVENHIYQLSQCLLTNGHKVVILTHAYNDHKRQGIRYLTNGLKVYYTPRTPVYLQSTAPTVFGLFRLFRNTVIREQIQIVHAHQAYSVMGNECLLYSYIMGLKTVFTDHSLFGFADVSSILANKALKWTLANVHHSICVSHTSKENTVLRVCLPPDRVSVIPNAVDIEQFKPDVKSNSTQQITIVSLTRLVYRKGIDLLALVIPIIAEEFPDVRFLIGGDGPKRRVLEKMIQIEGLEDRVSLLGAVVHEKARDVLVQGQIFLNASLTEAFCMAIVEAASCGCLVVSTRVGGVPEVLPSSMMVLSEPSAEGLIEGVRIAIQRILSSPRDVMQQHIQVGYMYNWSNIAKRTEIVYNKVLQSQRDDTMYGIMCRLLKIGSWAGKLACLLMIMLYWQWRFIEWWEPVHTIDIAPNLQKFIHTS